MGRQENRVIDNIETLLPRIVMEVLLDINLGIWRMDSVGTEVDLGVVAFRMETGCTDQ